MTHSYDFKQVSSNRDMLNRAGVPTPPVEGNPPGDRETARLEGHTHGAARVL